jgi:hypothetical protein
MYPPLNTPMFIQRLNVQDLFGWNIQFELGSITPGSFSGYNNRFAFLEYTLAG